MEKLQKENRLLKIKIEELESSLELAKEKLEMLEKLNRDFLANYKQRFEYFEMDAEKMMDIEMLLLQYIRKTRTSGEIALLLNKDFQDTNRILDGFLKERDAVELLDLGFSKWQARKLSEIFDNAMRELKKLPKK